MNTKIGLVILSFIIFGCLEPADEIFKRSGQESGVIFVKIPGHNVEAMEPERTNVNEFREGTDIFLLSPPSPRGHLVNLTKQFTQGQYRKGAAMDPEISADNKRMLFSMRRGYDSREADYDLEWHIWELNLATLEAKQLTWDGQAHNMDPAYLPNGQIIFTSTRTKIVDEYERRESPLLFVGSAERDDQGRFLNVRQISFNQSHDINPMAHSSGKIYFSRWEHLGSPNKMSIFTVNPDGSGLFVLYGNHSPRRNGQALLHMREMRDGRLVTSVMSRGSNFEGGAIGLVDISKSDNALTYITPGGSPYEGNDDRWMFQTPHPILDGEEKIIAAGARGVVRDGNDASNETLNYGLWLLDKQGSEPKLVYDDPDATELDPIPLEKVVDKIVLTASENVIDFSGNSEAKIASAPSTGEFFTSNVYFRSPGDGQMLPDASIEQVKYLRILEAIPMAGNGRGGQDRSVRGGDIGHTNQEKQRVVGYGPVQSDGSFSVKLPANVSLHMQTLDKNGMMLVNQKTWVQVIPGERRLCTGCHDSHERDKLIDELKIVDTGDTPGQVVNMDNVTQYLAGFHNSFNVTEHSAAYSDTLDFNDRINSDRKLTVQAVLDRNCVSCHGTTKTDGGLNLEHDAAGDAALGSPTVDSIKSILRTTSNVYNTLWPDMDMMDQNSTEGFLLNGEYRPYVTDAGARHSPLMWVLFNKRLDRKPGEDGLEKTFTYDHTQIFGTSGDIDPFNATNKDLLTLIEWIDAGAQYSNTVGY